MSDKSPAPPVAALPQRYFVRAERFIGYGVEAIAHPSGGWMLATEVERHIDALRQSPALDDRCKCGHPKAEHYDYSGFLVCDTCHNGPHCTSYEPEAPAPNAGKEKP